MKFNPDKHRTIQHHWMPTQEVQPTLRKFGLTYRLKTAMLSKTGGVQATYTLI